MLTLRCGTQRQWRRGRRLRPHHERPHAPAVRQADHRATGTSDVNAATRTPRNDPAESLPAWRPTTTCGCRTPGWQRLLPRQVVLGAAAGALSRIGLDSIMHAGIRPLARAVRRNR